MALRRRGVVVVAAVRGRGGANGHPCHAVHWLLMHVALPAGVAVLLMSTAARPEVFPNRSAGLHCLSMEPLAWAGRHRATGRTCAANGGWRVPRLPSRWLWRAQRR